MWCPECWRRFRWYKTVCPECRVELVAERPGPPPEPNAELVCVYVPLKGELLDVAKSLLEGETIEYVARFEGLQDLFGIGRSCLGYNLTVGPAELWVRADEAGRARARLESLGEPGPEGPTLDELA